MKKLKFLPLWALALAMGFAACKDDDKSPNVDEVIEDGFYLVGDATGYATPNLNAKMAPATNEAKDNEARTGMFDGYVYLEANKDFAVVENAAGALTTYGGALATIDGGASEEPAEDYLSGGFTKDGAKYSVPTAGLYHVVVDKQLAQAVIVPVGYWSIIGDAVGGWDDNQKLAPKQGASATKVEFEKTGVAIKPGEYKFRHTGGWKVTLDPTEGAAVRANLNFGGADTTLAPTALTAGGGNFKVPAAKKGIYTVSFVWEPRTGYRVAFAKTGDVSLTDWSAVEFGLRGDAYDGATGSWDANGYAVPPTKTGDVYTWAITSDMVAGKEFKITDGNTWLGAGSVTWSGDYEGNFSGTDNILIDVAGNYTFALTIDAANDDAKSIAVTKN